MLKVVLPSQAKFAVDVELSDGHPNEGIRMTVVEKVCVIFYYLEYSRKDH